MGAACATLRRMDDLWQHLLEPPETGKEERFHRVSWAMATALLRSSPDQVTVSDLARRSGVSRAWIYKYMGKDPDDRLAFAVRLFGQAFAAPAHPAPAESLAQWRERLADGTRKGLDDALKAPWCVLVYSRYRHSKHRLGEMIRQVEQVEVQAIVDRIPPQGRPDPKRARAFAWAFHAARLGSLNQWLDPDFRQTVGSDLIVAHLLGLADSYLAEVLSP